MALSAKVDTSVSPFTLTITSDQLKFSVNITVSSAGASATAEYAGQFPVTVVDDSGRAWAIQSDDGTTAVYTG
jgi:hypothetical protein